MAKNVTYENEQRLGQDYLNPNRAHCSAIPVGLVVRIRRSHRRGRGSIPRQGGQAFCIFLSFLHIKTLFIN